MFRKQHHLESLGLIRISLDQNLTRDNINSANQKLDQVTKLQAYKQRQLSELYNRVQELIEPALKINSKP